MDEIREKSQDTAKQTGSGGQSTSLHVNNGSSAGEPGDEEGDYIPDDGENSVDDEGTLEEEEAFENELDIAGEVAALQDEQDIPMEDLLRLYGYGSNTSPSSVNVGLNDVQRELRDQGNDDNTVSSSSSASTSNQDSRAHVHRHHLDYEIVKQETSSTWMDVDEDGDEAPSREHGYFSTSDEDSENDFDYVPEEAWKKEIKIGPDHQADVPDSVISELDDIDYSTDDLGERLWYPDQQKLTEDAVESYLRSAYEKIRSDQSKHKPEAGPLEVPTVDQNGSYESPAAAADDISSQSFYLRDDESALKLLLESHYDVDTALKEWETKQLEQQGSASGTGQLWTDEDQNTFEEGLRAHGKNFRLIQEQFLGHRTVRELVQYYYLWKRTERHDIFVQTYRFEKRQYALHPTATDYMDRFLDHMALVGASSSVLSSTSTGHHEGPHDHDHHSSPSLGHRPYVSLLSSATTSKPHGSSPPSSSRKSHTESTSVVPDDETRNPAGNSHAII